MNIIYETTNFTNKNTLFKIDKTKKNILILGRAITTSKQCDILKPLNKEDALSLYGESDLYKAYCNAYNITNDNNIYTANCFTLTDYIQVMDSIIQYDFHYIVPIGIYMSDTFYNPEEDKHINFATYYIDTLYQADSLSTVIFTERHAELYEDMDDYLFDMKEVSLNYNTTINESYDLSKLIEKAGSNLIFVLNILSNIDYANIIFAALLSINKPSNYPSNISFNPVFDFDNRDIDNFDFCYFKYNYLKQETSIENLLNLRLSDDIYKNVLIDEVIKEIIRKLDLDEFKGMLYNPYVKIQIENKVQRIMEELKDDLIKDFKIIRITFTKSSPTAGYIYIEINFIPYGSFEELKIIMGV